MFNREDEYLQATRDAKIHIVEENKSEKLKLILINITLLVTILVLVFLYLNKNPNIVENGVLGQKIAVLGVSHTSSKSEFSNDELMHILDNVDVENIVESEKQTTNTNLYNAISQELDDKNGFKGKIVTVKKGDTLSSLAEEYYGSSKAFYKIIQNNKNISEQSHTLYVGEKIKIAY